MLSPKPKNLAIVVPELLPVPPVKGGAVEYWVHEFSHKLNPDKYRVTIFSRPSGVLKEGAINYIGIPWTSLEKAFGWVKERVSWRNPLRYIAKIQNVTSYGWRVAKQVAKFDNVIIHNEPNLLLFINRSSIQILILHMHNEHLIRPGLRWVYSHLLNKVDSVIFVSEYIKLSAAKYFPKHAHKFVVVFNATDPNIFKPYGDQAKLEVADIVDLKANAKYLLYVGRLTADKGVDVLIKAFHQILENNPETKLIIVGSSFFEGAVKTAYQEELIGLANKVSHGIIFTGFIPHNKLKYLYSVVDCVVLPSVWQDPCPLVVLETMASGTCLIASTVGGVPEVVEHEVTGVLVEPNQVDDLVFSIQTMLNNPQDMVEIGRSARMKVVAGYTWDHLVENMEKILEQFWKIEKRNL